MLRLLTALIFDGNLFQSVGTDTINDPSPKVFLVMVLGGIIVVQTEIVISYVRIVTLRKYI